MSIPFLSSSKTVLLIADEALYIYATSARNVRLVETVPWEAESFSQSVSHIISRVCKGRPVLILNDMVEQHYRKERVLKAGVSIMDRGNMIKRKLNVAFPNYPIRAALPLKEKAPGEDKKKSSDIYIFTAIPASGQFQATVNAVNQSLASVSGFCLLPIESSDLVKTLSAKVKPKGEKKSEWTIFIGQHRNGGLRQVVTKNGELALTRMTPIIDDDSDPQEWASEVHQEYKATMSYLTRFGYQTEDGLDIILIANPESGDILEQMIEEECNFRTMNSSEAARSLGIGLGPQEDLRYADVLHVAWIARKNRYILPMSAPQISSVAQPRQVAMAASVLLVLSALYLGYQSGVGFVGMSSVEAEYQRVKQQYDQEKITYDAEKAEKEAQGFADLELVQNSILIYQDLQKQDVNLLYFFSQVGQGLGPDLNLDQITLKKTEKSALDRLLEGLAQGGEEPRLFESKMQLSYPSNTDIVRGNQEVRSFEERLKQVLPDHEVKVTKFLQDYEYSEEFVVEEVDPNSRRLDQDFVAEISIKGPVVND